MTKTNKKGFTLVELIIVIAILAILVAALAPALIKYIEKSRVSKDNSSLDNVYTAIKTACANETVSVAVKNDGKWYALDNVATDNSELADELFGTTNGTINEKYKKDTADADTVFKSKASKEGNGTNGNNKIYYKISSTYQVEVGLGKLSGSGDTATFTAASTEIPNISG